MLRQRKPNAHEEIARIFKEESMHCTGMLKDLVVHAAGTLDDKLPDG